jgi:hypothetical protein
VGFFYFVGGGVFGDAEDVVVVAFGGHRVCEKRSVGIVRGEGRDV